MPEELKPLLLSPEEQIRLKLELLCFRALAIEVSGCECSCGTPPYTDGNQCLPCTAIKLLGDFPRESSYATPAAKVEKRAGTPIKGSGV